MKKPRVLLTGASGRLGSVILEDLSDVWDIIPLSRRGGGGTVRCDLLSREDRKTLLGRDFDMVVNAAAVSSPSHCANNPAESWILNTLWPRTLAEYCRRNAVQLIHFSTDLVYSGGTPPYSEASPAVPMSFYGWTKLVADILVQKADTDALIVRTSVLCGETGSERTTFSENLLSGRVQRVFVDSWRNHTPIHWLAGILPKLTKKEQSGLVIASGKYSQSRSAYAEALLKKHGQNTDHLVQEYAPPGIPSRLHLKGKYYTSSIY
ncbi:MAG: sugar nucleotide-binding protein [Candidatus Aegiribacteria sp.]|nr:sugar nucleotide-binding protein [Candidatus Aegiribacteria sp.]